MKKLFYVVLLFGLGLSVQSFADKAASANEVADLMAKVSLAKGVHKVLCQGAGTFGLDTAPFRAKSGAFCSTSDNIAGYIVAACGGVGDFDKSKCDIAAQEKIKNAGANHITLANRIINAAGAEANKTKDTASLTTLCNMLGNNAINMAMCPKK